MSNGKLTVKYFNSEEKLSMLNSYLPSNSPLPQGFVNSYIGEGMLPLNFPVFMKQNQS